LNKFNILSWLYGKKPLIKGVKFGRPCATVPAEFESECRKWREGKQSAIEAMKRLGLKRTTFYKMVRQ